MFLEWRNTTKSLSNIWQFFSCPLDEGIPKICKKLNSHDGFLSYLQNSTANSAHLAAHFCPALVCPQKATENSISSIFLESSHQLDMKNVVECYKNFFGYFNALKTNCVLYTFQLPYFINIYYLEQPDLEYRKLKKNLVR